MVWGQDGRAGPKLFEGANCCWAEPAEKSWGFLQASVCLRAPPRRALVTGQLRAESLVLAETELSSGAHFSCTHIWTLETILRGLFFSG